MRNKTVFTGILLAIHVGLLAWSGYRHSPTIDEPAHLAAGISHWQFGRMDLYSVNPPLVRMIAALPVLAADPQTRWGQYRSATQTRAEFAVGEAFADANGPRIFWLITLARWACIPFSLLGGWICFRWSHELFGPNCALLALSLWCFSPTILANGSLITADVPAAALCVTSTFVFSHWLKQYSWRQVFMTGVCLGLALLTKSSLIVLCVLLPVMWAASWFIRTRMGQNSDECIDLQRVSFRRQILQLLGMLCMAVLILNLGYGFEGTGKPLGEYSFHSRTLGGEHAGDRIHSSGNRFEDSWTGRIPLPFPQNNVIGIDRQKFDFETGLRSYFRGEIRSGGDGWWWFYLYALAVKVPLGTWGLAIASLVVFSQTKRREKQLSLIVPGLVFLALVSCQVGLNFFRYLLPAFPFGFILISQAASRLHFATSPYRASVVTLSLTWSILSSLWYFPHSLSYFNEIAGGPKAGYRLMADANIDWGQDLIYLKEWIEEHRSAAGMSLHYYGPVAPVLSGLNVHDESSRKNRRQKHGEPEAAPRKQPHWIGISVTHLAYQAAFHRRVGSTKANWFAYLYDREPDVRIGYTIHLYRLNGETTTNETPVEQQRP